MNLPVVAGVIPSSDFVARFERCVSLEDAAALCASSSEFVAVRLSLSDLARCSPQRLLLAAAKAHHVQIYRDSRTGEAFRALLDAHVCKGPCERLVSLFHLVPCNNSASYPRLLFRAGLYKGCSSDNKPVEIGINDQTIPSSSRPRPPVSVDRPVVPRASVRPRPYPASGVYPLPAPSVCPVPAADVSCTVFPPTPPSIAAQASFVRDWCDAVSPTNTYEGACAICARLTLRRELSEHADSELPLFCLERTGELVTREPRCHSDQSPREMPGHILYPGGVRKTGGTTILSVCKECMGPLGRKQMPRYALANGRWLGECPPELQGLRYVEQLLIARNRHSFCVAQVSTGKQRYMTANAIIFGQPVARMYSVLPPPRKDIEECLAILFVGTAQPTNEDVSRTPFLVRHAVVMRALQWLMLNHPDYYHINISLDNMREYPEDEPPVGVVYRVRDTGTGENLAVNQTEIEHAVETGECSFVVHGLCGSEFANMTYDQKVRYAVRYFDGGGKAMYYGHERKPQSIYHNPTLFPSMFPWLFPYGLGSFENELMVKRLHRGEHIKALLLYPDRRFERDRCFAFIAFNHEQIRASAGGGYLLTNRNNFATVADKILALDREALDNIIERGSDGEYVRPETDAEKACFELISVVDHVAGHVSGLNTSRKYQRNEIKSLIMAKGMPLFFITFAPADLKNPLCLYYCGENVDLFDHLPRLRSADDRRRAIANHPAGAARFFDFLVKTFVRVILRYGQKDDGLFGPTEAYYGTVEAQGRLTLHLHMLVWIRGSTLR